MSIVVSTTFSISFLSIISLCLTEGFTEWAEYIVVSSVSLNTSLWITSFKVILIISFRGSSLTILTTESIILVRVSCESIGNVGVLSVVLLIAWNKVRGSSTKVYSCSGTSECVQFSFGSSLVMSEVPIYDSLHIHWSSTLTYPILLKLFLL